jgi:CheY-like chemotaxis protein
MIILHVDDDPEDREIFTEALKEVNANIQCLTSEDGLEAHVQLTDALLVQNLEYIFIDINMPLMDGIALLALIKGDRRLNKIPVYIYTTSKDVTDLAKIKKLGGNYIEKHADFKSLVEKLRSIFSKKMELK